MTYPIFREHNYHEAVELGIDYKQQRKNMHDRAEQLGRELAAAIEDRSYDRFPRIVAEATALRAYRIAWIDYLLDRERSPLIERGAER